MLPTGPGGSYTSQTNKMQVGSKSSNAISAPAKFHSFATSPRSSTAPLQAELADNMTPTPTKDREYLGVSIHDIPLYCCRVCEIEALPSTQSYDGPDEFHPLRLVGTGANEEWFRVHCAPVTVEQQVVRGRGLQQQFVGQQRELKEESANEVEFAEAAAQTKDIKRRRPMNRRQSPSTGLRHPATAGRGVFRVEKPQQQRTPDLALRQPVSPNTE